MKRVTEVRLTIAALIYAIEIDLKNCISKYITPYQKNFNFVGSQEVIDNMVRRFNKDNPSIEAEENKDEVLQYLDFGDFYRIIQSNKTFFPNSVILEVKDSIKSLEELSSVRNRVMHTRPLLSGDFSKAYAFAKEKESNNLEIWHSLQLTLSKIEEDPSYVLTLSIPTIKSTEFDIQHNLPIPDFDETGFIGRKKDAENVLKLILGNNRVVSIIGDGGIGKTALALKVAYDILDLKDKNPFDIIIWVSAKTTMLTAHGIKTIENSLVDYGGLLEGLIEGVGESSSVQNSLNTIIEYLDLFETLIIVDNLETILDEKIREFIRDSKKK
jgi:LuxR family glucitol operon transcriptional activator